MDLINDAKANGFKVETGGEPLDQPGYFISPTIFSNVSDGMRIVDEAGSNSDTSCPSSLTSQRRNARRGSIRVCSDLVGPYGASLRMLP